MEPGGHVSLEWRFQDQNQNVSGVGADETVNNPEKEILTNSFQLDAGYMMNRSFGLLVEVPYLQRNVSAMISGIGLKSIDQPAFGDLRLSGLFTGFSPEMSTGLTFGLKLPTGNINESRLSSGTQIGTGSTDLLLGIYHFSPVSGFPNWVWSMDFQWDHPLFSQNYYVPGDEIVQAFGLRYQDLFLGAVQLIPLFELSGSYRWNDTGSNADSKDSGSMRFLGVPGLEVNWEAWRLASTVGIPFYQNINGHQLVAPALVKVQAAYLF